MSAVVRTVAPAASPSAVGRVQPLCPRRWPLLGAATPSGALPGRTLGLLAPPCWSRLALVGRGARRLLLDAVSPRPVAPRWWSRLALPPPVGALVLLQIFRGGCASPPAVRH